MKLIERATDQRTFLRRMEWGMLTGAAGIVAGTVSLLSFGQLYCSLEWETVMWLADREFDRLADDVEEPAQ